LSPQSPPQPYYLGLLISYYLRGSGIWSCPSDTDKEEIEKKGEELDSDCVEGF
jgi:hypothetical protein